MRHNNVAQVLQDLASSVGFTCIREPNLHVRPAGVRDQPADSAGYGEHADLLLLKHDLKLYVDVTITRPTNATNLALFKRVLNTPLHSTREKERRKQAKYADIAQANEYQMVAFALESYGGLGAEAVRLLHTLAAHSRQYTPLQFLRHAYDRLSVTLQASNGDISQMGMQQLHLAQHARARSAHVAAMRRRFAGGGYSHPRTASDANRREQQLQTQLGADAADEAAAAAAYLHRVAAYEHDGRIAFADFVVRSPRHDDGVTIGA